MIDFLSCFLAFKKIKSQFFHLTEITLASSFIRLELIFINKTNLKGW